MRTKIDLRKIQAASPAPLDPETVLKLYSEGEHKSPDAAALVTVVRHALYLHAMPKRTPKERRAAGEWMECARVMLFNAMRNALRTGSGAFLRQVADAIETEGKPVVPAAAFVGAQLLSGQSFGLPVPTVPEMLRRLRQAGIPSNRISVARYYLDFGYTPPKGKPGAPRGKRAVKTKSPTLRASRKNPNN